MRAIFGSPFLLREMKNKVVSVLTMVFGSLEAVFGFFSLLGIFMQRLMMRATPSVSHPEVHRGSMEFWLRIEITHNIWLIFMPFLIALGILFVVSGYQLYKNKKIGVPLIRGASISIVLWFILYCLISLSFGPYLFNIPEMNDVSFKIFLVLSGIISFVVICGYPVFLLLYLSHKRLKTS
jgi:hypothetical protein